MLRGGVGAAPLTPFLFTASRQNGGKGTPAVAYTSQRCVSRAPWALADTADTAWIHTYICMYEKMCMVSECEPGTCVHTYAYECTYNTRRYVWSQNANLVATDQSKLQAQLGTTHRKMRQRGHRGGTRGKSRAARASRFPCCSLPRWSVV